MSASEATAMSADKRLIEILVRSGLAEVAGTVGARRCLVDLGTFKGRPVLCQVITQGGKPGLDQHRMVVHGIEAPR